MKKLRPQGSNTQPCKSSRPQGPLPNPSWYTSPNFSGSAETRLQASLGFLGVMTGIWITTAPYPLLGAHIHAKSKYNFQIFGAFSGGRLPANNVGMGLSDLISRFFFSLGYSPTFRQARHFCLWVIAAPITHGEAALEGTTTFKWAFAVTKKLQSAIYDRHHPHNGSQEEKPISPHVSETSMKKEFRKRLAIMMPATVPVVTTDGYEYSAESFSSPFFATDKMSLLHDDQARVTPLYSYVGRSNGMEHDYFMDLLFKQFSRLTSRYLSIRLFK